MLRAMCLAALLAVWSGGCEPLPLWDTLHLGGKNLDDVILGQSVTTLAGEGAVYPYTTTALAARSWQANLQRLGLEAHVDPSDCVHATTPDGQVFTINVFPTDELPGVAGSHCKAYLRWQQQAAATQGWQVLTDLERQHPPAR